MNRRWLLVFINLSIIITPWVIGQFVVNSYEGDAAQAAGFGMFLALSFTTLLTVCIGLLTTFLTRKSTNAFKYSVLGFGIPAGIVSLLCITSM